MMTSRGHVEIVGAGLAGLTAAAVLARQGFSVCVHERSSELREIGAGIYLKQNSVQVLKSLGAYESLKESGERLLIGDIRDQHNNIILRRQLEQENAYTILRGRLHRILADVALEAGVQIDTNSEVQSATAEGELTLSSGEKRRADLIVAADGVNSVVRESLGLTQRRVNLPDGATRLVIPRNNEDPSGLTIENWSGACRVGVVPCSPQDVYVFLIGPEDDSEVTAVPVDRESWKRKFPHLGYVIDRIADDVGRHDRHAYLEVKSWSAGRVALIGDAVHAQPPNLGQGAGMSMANAFALGQHLARDSDMSRALKSWENERRAVSEMVQRWSCRYGALGYRWPSPLYGLRSSTIRSIGKFGSARRKWGWLWRGGMNLETG